MVKIISVVAIILLATFAAGWILRQIGLARVPVAQDHEIFRKPMRVIAHRGGALERPENTLEAFSFAESLSTPDVDVAFELDVRITKDEKLVVLHDPTVDRTTDGKGLVSQLNYAEIRKLDAGYGFQDGDRFPFRGKGIYIPLLEEVLSRFPKSRMIVEIKDTRPDMGHFLREILDRTQSLNRVIVASEHSRVINLLRDARPDLVFGATRDEVYRNLILSQLHLEPFDSMRADAWIVPLEWEGMTIFSSSLLAEVHRRKKKLFLWTINDAASMRSLLNQGVDGIITDRPSQLINLLNEKPK